MKSLNIYFDWIKLIIQLKINYFVKIINELFYLNNNLKSYLSEESI